MELRNSERNLEKAEAIIKSKEINGRDLEKDELKALKSMVKETKRAISCIKRCLRDLDIMARPVEFLSLPQASAKKLLGASMTAIDSVKAALPSAPSDKNEGTDSDDE